MVYHTRCVARGIERALLVADLPFLSYQESPVQALRSAVQALAAPAQAVGLIEPGGRFTLAELTQAPAALAVGSFQPVIDRFVAQAGAAEVDYVHGDDALAQLALRAGCCGLHFPLVPKGELLKRVVHGGPLPRKTFSMGEADEKRFYVEARRIR
jgi:hypothetical protein